jgi:hypothetical protein
MRCTEETLILTSPAIAAAVQCVVSPGGSLCVSATPRAAEIPGRNFGKDQPKALASGARINAPITLTAG